MADRVQLAILGGTPAFEAPLHVNKPVLPDREVLQNRIGSILDSHWFTNDGPLVRELEQQIARFLGVRHCVLTSSGTIALELLARALDLGGEVIVPSFTFIATPNAMQWHGLKPVFCDIDPETLNIDPVQCEKLISPETSAILGVHLWGNLCQVEQLQQIADRNQIKLIFDAAHAFGCGDGERRAGGFGDAEIFSFHATKAFHCAEGGAVTTGDAMLADRLRKMRNFGFVGYDQTEMLGINGKMSELSAAMGLTMLPSLEQSLEKSRLVFERYAELLGKIPGITMQRPGQPQHNFHYVVTQVDEIRSQLRRDDLISVLHAENVFARRYFYPGCHRMKPYGSIDTCDPNLAHTERAAETSMVLPAGSQVRLEEVDLVCRIIQSAVSQAACIAESQKAKSLPENGPGYSESRKPR